MAEIIGMVSAAETAVSSSSAHLESNKVLAHLSPGLEGIGFAVERRGIKLPRPVLFGDEGTVAKYFNVDAFRSEDGVALEVEAGGAVYNNRILLDLIKFCLGADVRFGAILVPVKYETKDRSWQDPYPESVKLFDAIYANPERFRLPLEGLLIVGY